MFPFIKPGVPKLIFVGIVYRRQQDIVQQIKRDDLEGFAGKKLPG